jgi:putative inorganic carbon (HCO3(-)) transporter
MDMLKPRSDLVVPILLQTAAAIGIGVLAGVPFLLDMSTKWKVGILLGEGLVMVLAVAGSAKRVLLFAMVSLIPFSIGTGLPAIVERPEHIGLARGIFLQASDILVAGLLLVHLARMATHKAVIRLYPAITVPALAWIVASALSATNARDPTLSALQLFHMVRLALLYIVVANVLEIKADIRWILLAVSASIVFQGLLGSYQAINKGSLGLDFLGEVVDTFPLRIGMGVAYRASGTIGHPNGYAMYLSATMPFAVALLYTGVRRLYKVLACVVLAVGVIGLILSLSRGGWLGFLAGNAVILASAAHHRKGLGLRSVWIVMGALSVVLILSGLSQLNVVASRLTSDDRGSAEARITFAEGALAMIEDHPLAGVGLNNYTLVEPQYDMASLASQNRLVIVHNIYLLIGAETGLVGLGTFLWLLWSLLRQTWLVARSAQSDALWVAGVATLAACVSLCVHGMVDYDLLGNLRLSSLLWLFTALAAALRVHSCHRWNNASATLTSAADWGLLAGQGASSTVHET